MGRHDLFFYKKKSIRRKLNIFIGILACGILYIHFFEDLHIFKLEKIKEILKFNVCSKNIFCNRSNYINFFFIYNLIKISKMKKSEIHMKHDSSTYGDHFFCKISLK